MKTPSLETRLLVLERQLRHTRRLCAAALLGALFLVATAVRPSEDVPVRDMVRARVFEVLDPSGRAVLRLDATPQGGRVRVLAATLGPRAWRRS